jgi:2-polyprenyl-3-methyl-5-hydroxy-6-metoxy-1,4-benzoquinol methylase
MEELVRIYSTEADHFRVGTSEREAKKEARAANDLIAPICRWSSQRGRSLDVGSGGGEYSLALSQQGYKPVMIDLDPRAEDSAKAMIASGAEFYRVAFEDLPVDGPFLAIVMSHVLEHALDPLDWLRRAARLLDPQGVLVVALPNFGGIYRVLGARDPYLSPPVHLNFFTRASLKKAMETCGLEPLEFNSRSGVTLGPTWRRRLGRRVIETTWNTAATLLNPTSYGIVLRGYARRAVP